MVWKAYESLTKQRSDTLRWLLDTFNSSPVVKKKTFTSQEQHEGYRNSLCETVGRNGTKFGDLQLSAINRRMIRRYLYVAEKKVGANRHIQYMKAAWNWGNQRYSQVPEQNPCAKVTLNEEEARTRYVEDWEYALVKDIIYETTRSPYLATMMELAYLCRLRCSEVRDLKHSDIKDGLIQIIRGKKSNGELTRISPRLRAALDEAKSIHPSAPTPITGAYLLHSAKGLKISKNKFYSAWRRVMAKAVGEGITVKGKVLKLDEEFTFHDLKTRGVTNHTEHHSGHKSEKARQIYIRRLQEVDATECSLVTQLSNPSKKKDSRVNVSP